MINNNQEKDLNTYVDNICNKDYLGFKLIPSKSAKTELLKLGLSIESCKNILDKGYMAPRKRKKDTLEKWLDKGEKTYNVVVVKSYNYLYKEEVYLIKHIGKFTKHRRIKIWTE